MLSSDRGQAVAEYAIVCVAVLVIIIGLMSLIKDLENGRGWAKKSDSGMSHTVSDFGDSVKDVLLY